MKKKFCNGQKTFPGFQLGFLSKVDGFFGFYIRFCMWRIRFWPKKIFSASPSQIFLKRQKNGQIVSKQVKNRSKQVRTFFFKACAFRHLFSVPHSICCYFLATPATYFAKMAKKSKFHCIWLIFRKMALNQEQKSSATQKVLPMGSFRVFPLHLTWKADLWKVSRKPHLEYSHGFLSKIDTKKEGKYLFCQIEKVHIEFCHWPSWLDNILRSSQRTSKLWDLLRKQHD